MKYRVTGPPHPELVARYLQRLDNADIVYTRIDTDDGVIIESDAELPPAGPLRIKALPADEE